MNVKLCVQLLSNRVATAIDACRKMQLSGFEDSEATTEFLRINNQTFDILNTLPYGNGNRAPLTIRDRFLWEPFIKSAKEYYSKLAIGRNGVLVPLHETPCGTFVRGLLTALTSIENIMGEIETGVVNLMYVLIKERKKSKYDA